MPHPSSGERLDVQVHALRMAGVEVIVSLLAREEISELCLQEEPALCERHQMEFIWFPITDHHAPASMRRALRLIRKIVARLQQQKRVAIHCRMGIGRSGMIAAGTLMMLKMDMDAALKRLSEARGAEIPETEAQRRWLKRMSRRILAESGV